MKNEKVHLGLIGTGKWGSNYIKTIEKNSKIKLCSILNKSGIIKSIYSQKYDVKSDLNDFLLSSKFDGIIVCVPPQEQFNIAKKCVERKIPLLLEKPLSFKKNECDRLIDLSKRNKVKILINHIFIESEQFKAFKKEAKKYTNIRSFVSYDGNSGPYRTYMSPLWDWAPHSLSICITIFGNPLEIELVDKRKNVYGTIYEIKLFFSNNISANLEIGNGMTKKTRYFEINFQNSDFKLILDDLLIKKVFKKFKNKKKKYIKFKHIPALETNLLNFRNRILSGWDNDLTSLKLARKITYIIDCLENNRKFKTSVLIQ